MLDFIGNLFNEESYSQPFLVDLPNLTSLPIEIVLQSMIEPSNEQNYRIYIFDNRGTRRDYYKGLLPLVDPSIDGKLIGIDQVGFRANGQLIARKHIGFSSLLSTLGLKPTKLDWGYKHADGKSISKFIADKNGRRLGLFTLTEGKKLVIKIDLSLDRNIDYMAIYDATTKRISFWIREKAEVLRFFEDLIEGKNALCRMQGATGSNSDPKTFGLDVPEKASLFPCKKNNGPGGAFSTGTEWPQDPSSSILDAICADVLSQSGPSPIGGGLADPPTMVPMTNKWKDVAEGMIEIGEGVADGTLDADDALDLEDELSDDLLEAGARTFVVSAAFGPLAAHVGFDIFAVSAAASFGIKAGVFILRSVKHLQQQLPAGGPGTSQDAMNSMVEWCERRNANRASWSLQALDAMLARQDCPDPAETGSGVTDSGVTESTPGDISPPQPTGPWVPFSPETPLDGRNCVEPEVHYGIEGLLRKLGQRECGPTESPGPDGTCSDNPMKRMFSTPNADIGIAYADTIGIDFSKWIGPAGPEPAPIDTPNPN